MTDRTILTSIWTSVLAALVAVLSALGFGGKVAPAAPPPVAPPRRPSPPPCAGRPSRPRGAGGR